MLCVAAMRARGERVPDREIGVVEGNVAVVPCAAAVSVPPPAGTEYELNGTRLLLTGEYTMVFCFLEL